MWENTYRVLFGKQEEKNKLQELDTDGSQSNLSYRSRFEENWLDYLVQNADK